MSRKITTVSPMREVKTTRTVRFSPLLNNTVNVTEDLETFDILPKTDYTYARSGSYSPRYLNKKYTTPNMSRRGLRKIVTPGASLLSDSDSDVTTETENRTNERIVTRSRMELRSGRWLTWEERLQAEQEEKRRRSSSTSMSNSTQAEGGTPLGVLNLRQSATHPDHDSRRVTRKTTSVSKSYLVAEDSDDQDEDYADSKLTGYREGMETSSGKWLRSQTEESRLQKEMTESEYEEWISGKRHQKDGVRWRHSQSTEQVEVSDDEDINLSLRRGRGGKAESRGFISRFFFFMTTVVTTVVTTTTEYSYSAAKVVTTPVWTYLLGPVYHRAAEVTRWIDETIITTIISRFIILDTWLLSRGARNCCCLCLPLFLLLPLLCGGGYYLYKSDLKGSTFHQISRVRTYFFDSVRTVIPTETTDGRREWLTKWEIEDLVQGMLDPQMKLLQLSMTTITKEGNSHQETWKMGQEDLRVRLAAMEKQMAALLSKTKEDNVNILNLYNEMKPVIMNKEWLNRSEIEELVRGMLDFQIELLRQSLLVAAKEGSHDQEARQRLDAMGTQLAELMILVDKGNLGTIQDESKERLETMEKHFVGLLDRTQIALTARLEAVEKELADLKAIPMLGEEDLARLRAELMRCCKDDAALLAIIRGEVARMLAGRSLGVAGQVSTAEIQGLIDAALLKYGADKTGLPDYALESNGGSVVNIRCSKTYTKRAATVKLWGIPLYYTVNGPRTVIQPEVLPGNCWPFEGHEGSLVVQLAIPVKPTVFILEHIGKNQSIFGNNKSAPRNFTVLGLNSESDTEGQILGRYHYDAEGTPLQHFDVQMQDPGVFQFVELRVTSNYGNEEYTCLYRFRVYGLPQEHNSGLPQERNSGLPQEQNSGLPQEPN